MRLFIKSELQKFKEAISTLEFKPTVILVSIPFIIFISVIIANPYFYIKVFGGDKFESRVYWLLADGIIMFIIPALIIILLFREKLSNFGFRLGDIKFGFITLGLFLLVMIPIIWIVSASESFAIAYPQGGQKLKENPSLLIFYEFCILVYMFGWEFLWRGFTLFGLFDKFGYYAILIQMIPFFILHRGKPELELFASIFAGIVLGIQALRSRSFIYSWILHWLVMVSIDLISVLRYKLNFYKII
ncbi:MAG: CPBP family intramembrane metalloprotease [Ignavibacteria bacterium]|nr:CPBP family intramembrane metalloprotease [Ignavibacteria bacterium]